MNRPTKPLTLSGVEVVFLADSITNKDVAEGLPERDVYLPLAREALLLLGSAYRELVTQQGIDPGPLVLQVNEEIAWLLRGKVRTGDLAIDGKTNVGVPLLLKLYELLNAFSVDLPELPPVAETEGQEISENDREFLHLLKEHSDARTKSNENPNSDPRAGV